MREVAQRLVRFAVPPLIALTTPFLVLPLIARVASPEQWVALAIGQSVGGFAALVVSQGYNLTGPVTVAVATSDERLVILRRSLDARLLVYFPLVVVTAVVAVLFNPHAPLVAGAASIAFASVGLSNAWYVVGCSEVLPIITYEMLPRLAAAAISIPAIAVTHQVLIYPVLLLAANVIGPTLFATKRAGAAALIGRNWRGGLAEIRGHRHAMISEVVGGTYTSLLITLVGLSAPLAQTALYVSGDRIYRIGQNGVSTTANALQGWFAEDIRRRTAVAIGLQSAIGMGLCLALGLFGPACTTLLFGHRLAIPVALAWFLGGSALFVSVNTAISRYLLLPADRTRAISISVVIGAAVGVPAVVLATGLFGAVGAAAALCGSELIVAVIQLAAVIAAASPRPAAGIRAVHA